MGKEGRIAKLRLPHHVRVIQIKAIVLERLHALKVPDPLGSVGNDGGNQNDKKKENEGVDDGGSGGAAALASSSSGDKPILEIELTLNLARDPVRFSVCARLQACCVVVFCLVVLCVSFPYLL